MSSLINKAKEKIEATLDKNSNQANNPHSSNAGPHSSNLMNKGDPRIDSDRDHRNDPTSHVGGIGSTQEYNTIHGQTTTPGGVGGVEPGYGHTAGHTASHTAGHTGGLTGHSAGHTGLAGDVPGQGVGHTTHSTGHTGPVGQTGYAGGVDSGYGGATNTYDNPQSANTGPHRSNLANKLDPRVDSDNDNRNDPTSRVGGYGSQTENYGHNTGVPATHGAATHGGVGTTGGYGSGATTGFTGSHDHHTGVSAHHGAATHGGVGHTGGYDQGATTHGGVGHAGGYGQGTTTGTHGHSSITPGSGKAANTAGPHNSDLMNKLDPRVDADLDGSKTYGGNATYR